MRRGWGTGPLGCPARAPGPRACNAELGRDGGTAMGRGGGATWASWGNGPGRLRPKKGGGWGELFLFSFNPPSLFFYLFLFVGHLFSNAVYQEQGNTTFSYYGPLSSEALSPHEYNAHQTKVKGDTFI
jgi:hypothetical protein